MPLPTPPDLRRSVPVELDRTRRLRYDFGALEALEESYGISLINPEHVEAAMVSAGKFARVVWAGCLAEDPAVTLQQIQHGMCLADLGSVATAVMQALRLNQRSHLAAEIEADPFKVAAVSDGETFSAAAMDCSDSSLGNSGALT